jgi:hypothetical protein
MCLLVPPHGRRHHAHRTYLRTANKATFIRHKRYVILAADYDIRCSSGQEGHKNRPHVHYLFLTRWHEWKFTVSCFQQHLMALPNSVSVKIVAQNDYRRCGCAR